MIRARKIFSAARALPTTVSCITGMEPESQALARRVGPVESLVKHDPALRGPEPRLRCVPPTANICGGFGIFISGRARALRPAGGGRGGGGLVLRVPARPGAVLVVLACEAVFPHPAVYRRLTSAAPCVPPCSFPCLCH